MESSLCSSNISFPSPNRFIPETLSIKTTAQENPKPLPIPTTIVDNDKARIFAAVDDRFLVPEISWIFTFRSPLIARDTPQSKVLSDLFCHAINERLNAKSYDAQLAGLHYTLNSTRNGINLSISGFSEKAPILLKEIVSSISKLSCTKEEFGLYKDHLLRTYRNTANKSPVTQGVEQLWSILYKNFARSDEKEDALKALSYEEFNNFKNHLFEKCFTEGQLYGNQSLEEANRVWVLLDQSLNYHPFPKSEHTKIELGILPEGKDPSFLVKKSKLPGNVVLLTMDCGDFSFKRRAAHEILTKGLEEPFFSELRTRQQTGYMVKNWSQEIERHLYSFFLVESSTHDTRELLARFELFLESSLRDLSSQIISEDRFESIRQSLITHLDHPALQMEKMAEVLHLLAVDYDADFSWLEKRKQGLSELTYKEFKAYAEEFLGKENRRRFAVCINGSFVAKDPLRYRRHVTPENIREEIRYQSRPAIR